MCDAQASFRKSANVERVTDKRKDSLFRLVDTDGSGTIDAQEFAVLYDAIKKDLAEELEKEAALQKEASSARRRVKMLLLFVAVLVSFLAASVAANFAVIFTVVDQAVTTTTTSEGILEVKGSDTIAKTAIATHDLPLVAAPMLDMETLSEVKSLKVSYTAGRGGDRTQAQLAVVGVRKHNTTFVEFVTDVPGETVEILNGVASLVRYSTQPGKFAVPKKFAICSGNVTCSAFRVSGVDPDVALASATAELEKHGFGRGLQIMDCFSGGWQFITLSGGSIDTDVLFFDGHVDKAGNPLPRHVVFLLHGLGGDKTGMASVYNDASLRISAFEQLLFVFPSSPVDCFNPYSGYTTTGWATDVGNSMSHVVGAVQLALLMCGSASWAIGASCGSGILTPLGVGPSSEVMIVGFSNGAAMAMFASWYYGDTVTRVSAMDYHPEYDFTVWMPYAQTNTGGDGFAAKLYYDCSSPTYSTRGLVPESGDPADASFWAAAGGSYSYAIQTTTTLSNDVGGNMPSNVDFLVEYFNNPDGRFFSWLTAGLDASGGCAVQIPEDYPGHIYPTSWGWNVHIAVPEVTKTAVVQDILDWVTPPPTKPPISKKPTKKEKLPPKTTAKLGLGTTIPFSTGKGTTESGYTFSVTAPKTPFVRIPTPYVGKG